MTRQISVLTVDEKQALTDNLPEFALANPDLTITLLENATKGTSPQHPDAPFFTQITDTLLAQELAQNNFDSIGRAHVLVDMQGTFATDEAVLQDNAIKTIDAAMALDTVPALNRAFTWIDLYNAYKVVPNDVTRQTRDNIFDQTMTHDTLDAALAADEMLRSFFKETVEDVMYDKVDSTQANQQAQNIGKKADQVVDLLTTHGVEETGRLYAFRYQGLEKIQLQNVTQDDIIQKLDKPDF